MATNLASPVRGQDITTDAEALPTIAAEQLGISPYAFRDVVDTFVSRLDPDFRNFARQVCAQAEPATPTSTTPPTVTTPPAAEDNRA